MKEENQNIALYQNYLDGLLSDPDKRSFEKRILEDIEFSNGFDKYKELDAIIAEVYEVQEAKKEILDLIDFKKPLEGDDLQVASKKRHRIRLFAQLAMAASFALIWLVWQPTKMSSSEVVNFGFAAVEQEVNSLNYPVGNGGKTRDFSEIRNFELAVASFKEGSFEQSKARLLLLLEKIEPKDSLHKLNIISWVMLCDINTGSSEKISGLYSKNISWVQKLEVNSPNEYDFFHYVYSLHLLSQKKNREAKNFLEPIVKRGGKYSTTTRELRQQVRFLLP